MLGDDSLVKHGREIYPATHSCNSLSVWKNVFAPGLLKAGWRSVLQIQETSACYVLLQSRLYIYILSY
jgi:hypothetical protein